jgi:hypothetical protein
MPTGALDVFRRRARSAPALASLTLLAVCLVLAAGCDSDPPLQASEEQQVDILISAVDARVALLNAWDLFEDQNGDDLPDDLDGDGNGDNSL